MSSSTYRSPPIVRAYVRTCVRAASRCTWYISLPSHPTVHLIPFKEFHMKAPVLLSCSHAVFAFCCFSAFPRTVPRLLFRRYSRQQVKFAFCPTWAGKAPSRRLRCDGLGLPPERYTVFGTCNCGDETSRGTVGLCRGGISARINHKITYLLEETLRYIP